MNLLAYIKKPVTSSQLLDTVQKTIVDNEQILTELQKDQWSEGKDKEGKIIGRYKPFTENKAQELPFPNKPKKAGQPYNLDWSGDLKRRTFVKTKIISKDILVELNSNGSALLKLFATIKKHGLIRNPNTIFGFESKKLDVVTKIVTKESLKKLKNKTR